jgi:hypothetical protein
MDDAERVENVHEVRTMAKRVARVVEKRLSFWGSLGEV